MKFPLVAILIALSLFAVGYYPAQRFDAPDGLFGLGVGLGAALLLSIPSYYVMIWSLSRNLRVFMVTFGVGFLVRMILITALFLLYRFTVDKALYSFGAGLGVLYLLLCCFEALSYASYGRDGKTEEDGEEGGSDEEE